MPHTWEHMVRVFPLLPTRVSTIAQHERERQILHGAIMTRPITGAPLNEIEIFQKLRERVDAFVGPMQFKFDAIESRFEAKIKPHAVKLKLALKQIDSRRSRHLMDKFGDSLLAEIEIARHQKASDLAREPRKYCFDLYEEIYEDRELFSPEVRDAIELFMAWWNMPISDEIAPRNVGDAMDTIERFVAEHRAEYEFYDNDIDVFEVYVIDLTGEMLAACVQYDDECGPFDAEANRLRGKYEQIVSDARDERDKEYWKLKPADTRWHDRQMGNLLNGRCPRRVSQRLAINDPTDYRKLSYDELHRQYERQNGFDSALVYRVQTREEAFNKKREKEEAAYKLGVRMLGAPTERKVLGKRRLASASGDYPLNIKRNNPVAFREVMESLRGRRRQVYSCLFIEGLTQVATAAQLGMKQPNVQREYRNILLSFQDHGLPNPLRPGQETTYVARMLLTGLSEAS